VLLPNSVDERADRADIVFECSGDTLHAARVLSTAGGAGDQPGAFAALYRESVGPRRTAARPRAPSAAD
jgi:hypothetical protein